MNIPLTISTWIHVTSAVLLVGGVFFFRVLLLKYAAREGGLSDELRNAIAKRWLHAAWGLSIVLLVSGLYNLTQKSDAWKAVDLGINSHMIFGIKFLFFLAVIGVLSVSSFFASKGKPAPKGLLTTNVFLGLIIVLLSAVLSNSY